MASFCPEFAGRAESRASGGLLESQIGGSRTTQADFLGGFLLVLVRAAPGGAWARAPSADEQMDQDVRSSQECPDHTDPNGKCKTTAAFTRHLAHDPLRGL